MSTPKVTVIIPTYNRARYLSDAIHSVLNQTLDELEAVVVDDGSTDATAELVSAIGDQRVRYLRQPHRGISAAMNAGMRSACGQYIARLDSDDLWLPEMLAALVGILDAQPAFGVAYGKGQAMDHEGHPLDHIQGMSERFPGDALRSLVYDDCTCNVALVARRECFDHVGFYDESLVANEDWDLWLRVARHYRFCFVDQIVARIRLHDENFTGLSSPRFAEVLNARTVPLDKLFTDPELPPAIRAMKSAAYTNVYLFRGQRWLQKRAFKRAGREFGLALRASEQPLTTGVRIAWFALALPVLKQTALGRRAVGALAALRQRRRARRESTIPDE